MVGTSFMIAAIFAARLLGVVITSPIGWVRVAGLMQTVPSTFALPVDSAVQAAG